MRVHSFCSKTLPTVFSSVHYWSCVCSGPPLNIISTRERKGKEVHKIHVRICDLHFEEVMLHRVECFLDGEEN